MRCRLFALSAFVAFILLILPLAASADTNIRFTDFYQKRYNLGDKLKVTHLINTTEDLNVRLIATLNCPSIQVEYFIVSFLLSAGQRVEIAAPALALTSRMLGECTVSSRLEAIGEGTVAEERSPQFFVGGELEVFLETDSKEIRPSDGLEAKTRIRASYENFKSANVIFSIDGQEAERFQTNVSSFTRRFKLFENMSAGEHTVSVNVADEFGNAGANTTIFSVLAVPTTLKIFFSNQSVPPGGDVRISVLLYDQAGDRISDDASFEIYNPGKDKLYSQALETGAELAYAVEPKAAPGAYLVKAYSTGLKAEDSFMVQTLEQLDVDLMDGKFLVFANAGNVEYSKPADIVLTSTSWEYLLRQKLSLATGESEQLNLFKEVPADTYTVKVVKSDGTAVIFEDIATVDERSLAKKAGDALASITGLIPGIDVGPTARGTANKVPGFVYILVIALALAAYVVYRGGIKLPNLGGMRPVRKAPQPSQPQQQIIPRKMLDRISEQREEFAARPAPRKPAEIKSGKQLTRDDPEVKRWLQNLKKDKKL